MKRLSRVSIDELEREYERIMKTVDDDGPDELHRLSPANDNDDKKTFLIVPKSMLIEYDNNQLDTTPRPGAPGMWEASERWIGR